MTEPTVKKATLVELKNYFGYEKISDFNRDWKLLSDQDKIVLRTGVGNGSLTY